MSIAKYVSKLEKDFSNLSFYSACEFITFAESLTLNYYFCKCLVSPFFELLTISPWVFSSKLLIYTDSQMVLSFKAQPFLTICKRLNVSYKCIWAVFDVSGLVWTGSVVKLIIYLRSLPCVFDSFSTILRVSLHCDSCD